MTAVEGLVEPGFEPVADVFAANFATRGEVGAGVCVHHEGRKVVDLWGGIADPSTGKPWTEDTLVLVFSTTKGVLATCANRPWRASTSQEARSPRGTCST